jgi:hypothetical protein
MLMPYISMRNWRSCTTAPIGKDQTNTLFQAITLDVNIVGKVVDVVFAKNYHKFI